MSFKSFWGSNASTSSGKSSSSHELAISDILPTAALRTELLLLVVLCIDSMRDDLSSSFDGVAVPRQDDQEWPGRERVQPRGASDPVSPPAVDLGLSQMQGLKQAAVTFFNSWRMNVLRRMGEKLNVRSDSVKEAKARHQSQAAAAARAKKDQEYYDWASGKDVERRSDTRENSASNKAVLTDLIRLEHEKRVLVLHCCLLLLLSLENYPAHSRVLLQHICRNLDIPLETLSNDEAVVAHSLLETANAKMAAEDVTQQQANEVASAKRWKVGLATVAGAAVIGITGGLAAPLLLGVGGAIMGGVGLGGLASLLGATIANPLTIAALFGAMGGKMTGRAVEEYEREVRDFKFVPLEESGSDAMGSSSASEITQSPSPQSNHRLRVAIGISGWLTETSEITSPWTVLSSSSLEPFALQYEREVLLKLGSTLTSILRDSAYSLAQASFLQVALPAVISTALLPVTLLRAGRYLNNPFSLSMERSDKAGKILAAALMARAQGERPVSLMGYSLGARVIYSCILELASHKAFGLVENVILMGAPTPTDEMSWRKIRAITVGRVVNIYTTNDLLLAVLYRTTKAQINVAGLQPIDNINGIQNFNATGIVNGHHQYRFAVGPLLHKIGFEDLDLKEVKEAEEALMQENEMEREVHEKARQAGELKEQEDASGRIIMVDATKVEAEEERQRFQRSGGSRPQPKKEQPSSVPNNLLNFDDNDGITQGPNISKRNDDPPSQLVELAADRKYADLHDSDEDESLASRIQMVEIDPEPEPELQDPGPPVETVRFGGPDRGFSINYDRR